MGVFSAVVGQGTDSSTLHWSCGTLASLTQPTDLTAAGATAVADPFRFVQVDVPGTEGRVRVEWVPIPDYNPTIPLPVSVIIGSSPPVAAVLHNDRFDIFTADESSNTPQVSPASQQTVGMLFKPMAVVFQPAGSHTGLAQFLNNPDDDGALSTVGDAVSVGAGLGAAAGFFVGGPAGAATGAALGAGGGFCFGVGMVIGEQIAIATQ